MVDLGKLSPVNAEGETEYTVEVVYTSATNPDTLKFSYPIRVYANGDAYIVERISDAAQVMILNRDHIVSIRCEDNAARKPLQSPSWLFG